MIKLLLYQRQLNLNMEEEIPYAQSNQNFEAVNEEQIRVRQEVLCRICLEDSQESQSALISACNCTGSLKYVHEECLISWIQKIMSECSKKIGSGKAHILCELCHSNIKFETKKKLQCNKREEIKRKIKEKLRNLILLILLVLVNFGFCFALLDYLLKFGFTTLRQNNVVLVSLIISGQVILGTVGIIAICFIIKNYFFKSKIYVLNLRVISQYHHEPPQRHKNNSY